MKQFRIFFICIISILFINRAYSQETDTLVAKAMEYYENAQYDSAAILFEKALPFLERKYGGTDTSYYSKQVNYTALSFSKSLNPEKAEEYYQILILIFESIQATHDEKFANTLNDLASLYIENDQYEKAEPLFRRAVEIGELYLGENNSEYIKYIYGYGSYYYEIGEYQKAEPLYIKAVELSEKKFGKNNSFHCYYLRNLGQLYMVMGHYQQSEVILNQALELQSSLPKEDETNLAQILNTLGALYMWMGHYEKAEPLLIQVKNIMKAHLGKNNPNFNVNIVDYGIALNNLGMLYWQMGKFEQAEQLMLQVLNIDKEHLGETHSDYAIDLQNLSSIYISMGRYEQAEPLLEQAIEIRKSKLLDNHPEHNRYLVNLADLYMKTGRYEEAEPLYIGALESAKIQLGENHSDYTIYLNNLGQLYMNMGKIDKAEPLISKAVELTKNQLGEEHPYYIIYLASLAQIKQARKQYALAEDLYKQSLDIIKKQKQQYNLQFGDILINLSKLYNEMQKYDLVININKEILQRYQYQVNTNTGFLSDYELKLFLNSYLFNLDIYQSINCELINTNFSIGGFACNIELSRKGILLKSALGIKNRILESKDTSLTNAYYELRILHKQINRLEQSFLDKSQDLKPLKSHANELEKTLILKSKDYKLAKKENEIDWQAIKKNLNPKEAAIEFSCFHYFDGKESTYSILYCAIVLRKIDSIPQMTYLGNESEILSIISTSKATNREINFIYQKSTFYEKIWQPIDSLLKGIETIYYAPSGLLNSVSLAAIPCPDEKLLMDKYNLVQLSSTRTLALPSDSIIINNAVVYGGINYDTDSLTLSNNAVKYAEDQDEFIAYNRSYTGDYRSGFRYLPGSQEEMESISEKLEKRDIPFTSFSGSEAIEESFLALSGNDSPSLIHLSTHGFYFPDTVSEINRKNLMYSSTGEIRFRYNDDPLLRSGLLMAGSNLAWKGQNIPDNVEDGILTAKEVSNMNLMNTELVVLSACQSGLGDVKGSEGVEGLQRGFKMAGVRYIIMSLWQVPDKETTEFMVKFYDHWLGGKEIHEAFHHTQKHMRHKYKDEPFKWAGFVLME